MTDKNLTALEAHTATISGAVIPTYPLKSERQISVLCVASASNYYQLPNLDLWPEERDAYKFTGNNPVITHAPCQQWSRMHAFARSDQRSKELAFFCFSQVKENGGIFEHPAGSHFFKTVGASFKQIVSIDQHWWGFPTRKRTYLFFQNCSPAAHPLNFDHPVTTLEKVNPRLRSIMPLSFCKWLVDSVSPLLVYHNSHHAPFHRT